MKKRVWSLLLTLSLLLGMTGTTFAGATSVKGYTMENPMNLNGELKITDLKTANGTWKNASIKVTEVQVDNVGYKKVNSTQALKYSDSALRALDAVKVKITYTFSGFTGNKNSLIKDNLLAERIDAVNSKGIFNDGGQVYSGFANGLYNKVEKYSLGGKTYKGEWYGKKIKDINFSKPVTLTGYVYVVLDKGKTAGSFVNFTFSNKNNVEKSEAYFVFSNKVLESRIKKTGSYIYGDEQLGIAKAEFEMTPFLEEDESLSDAGITQKLYRLGTAGDSIIEYGVMGSEDDAFTEAQIDEITKATAEKIAGQYELEMKVQNNIYSIVGICEVYSKYVNMHVVNKGTNYVVVMIYSDIKEKASADQLWESYKSNNDLTATSNTDLGTFETANQPKEAAKKILSKYNYGAEGYGTFASLEELQPVPDPEAEILRYRTKNDDSFFVMQFFYYSKPTMANLDANIKESLPNATVGTLDQGNIVVYADNGYSDGSVINLVVVRGSKIYTFIIGLPLNAEAQKETVIKSYLMSLGYPEQQAETLSTAAIFD